MRSKFILLFSLLFLSSCLPQLQYANDNQGDKNENGVRDDIEEYINATYDDPNLRKALFQYSHDSLILETPNLSKEELIKNHHNLQRSMYCIWFVTAGPWLKDYHIRGEISDREKNSWKNWYNARKAGEALGMAQVPSLDIRHDEVKSHPENVCRFKIPKKDIEKYRKRIKWHEDKREENSRFFKEVINKNIKNQTEEQRKMHLEFLKGHNKRIENGEVIDYFKEWEEFKKNR